jgi:hypothetical protein
MQFYFGVIILSFKAIDFCFGVNSKEACSRNKTKEYEPLHGLLLLVELPHLGEHSFGFSIEQVYFIELHNTETH